MAESVGKSADTSKLEQKISDGLKPPCPLCGSQLTIGRKQTGASGAVGYPYRCSKDDCTLVPGFATASWLSVIKKSLQSRAVQLALTAIGSVTVAGILAFALKIVAWTKNDKPTPETSIHRVTLPKTLEDKTTYFYDKPKWNWEEPFKVVLEGTSQKPSPAVFRITHTFGVPTSPGFIRVSTAVVSAKTVQGYGFLVSEQVTPESVRFLGTLAETKLRIPVTNKGDILLLIVMIPKGVQKAQLDSVFTIERYPQ